MSALLRRLALPLAFLLIALPVGVGAVTMMGDPKPESELEDSAFQKVDTDARVRRQLRAEPRWEQVAVLTGTGPMTRTVPIGADAIQWRAEWSCRSGAFSMTVGREGAPGQNVATSTCPDVGVESTSGSATAALKVAATGPWRVVVRRQVDTALEEPPMAGMTVATVLARGRFHSIQNRAMGSVEVYGLASGRLALRYEDFYTSASPGLRVWLTGAPNIKTTLQARQAKHIDVGVLRSTLGSYNQVLPATIRVDQFRSIVIWCPTVLIAFGAAPLTIVTGG